MDAQLSQMTVLQINLILANILSWDQDFHISFSFSHCHSQSGVPFNKEADWMVNAFMIHENAPHISCFGNTPSIEASNWLMMTGITAAGSQSTEATAGWKYDTRLSPSPLKSTIKRHITFSRTWLPMTCTKCPKSYVPLQATHPIGEYYFDWPDCFPDYCPGGIIQTCQHIKFTICSRYQKHFTSLQQWKKAKNNNGLFISFHFFVIIPLPSHSRISPWMSIKLFIWTWLPYVSFSDYEHVHIYVSFLQYGLCLPESHLKMALTTHWLLSQVFLHVLRQHQMQCLIWKKKRVVHC